MGAPVIGVAAGVAIAGVAVAGVDALAASLVVLLELDAPHPLSANAPARHIPEIARHHGLVERMVLLPSAYEDR